MPVGGLHLAKVEATHFMNTNALEYIRERMDRKKLNQSQIGKLTRVLQKDERLSQGYMSEILSGTTALEDVDRLRRETLRRVLDISLEDWQIHVGFELPAFIMLESHSGADNSVRDIVLADKFRNAEKPVRKLDRAGHPILPHEATMHNIHVPPEHDHPDLELYFYEGQKLSIAASSISTGDIIAMMPSDSPLENGRTYVIRHGSKTLVARCARAGKSILFITDDETRDAISESKAKVLGRVSRYWNQHEA